MDAIPDDWSLPPIDKYTAVQVRNDNHRQYVSDTQPVPRNTPEEPFRVAEQVDDISHY